MHLTKLEGRLGLLNLDLSQLNYFMVVYYHRGGCPVSQGPLLFDSPCSLGARNERNARVYRNFASMPNVIFESIKRNASL
jgi:hypothetical protein